MGYRLCREVVEERRRARGKEGVAEGQTKERRQV